MDGTEYFSAQTIHCPHCSSRTLKSGKTHYFHTAVTPVIVCPGNSQVISLVPEFVIPQDGHDKQDCETAAAHLPSRKTFFDDLRALTRYLYFNNWDHLLSFMIEGLELDPGVNTT